MTDTPLVATPVPDAGLISWTHVIYGLHAFSVLTGILTPITVASAFVFGWPSIIAVILNYVKRSEVRGTYLDSHFSWQIRTFWYAFGVTVLAWLFAVTFIGIPIAVILIFVLSIWIAYRVVRGWLALKEGKPLPQT